MTRSNGMLFIFLLGVFSVAASTEWTLKKSDAGITVFTKSYTGSDIKAVRVIDSVHTTLSSIVALLLDTKKYPTWIYHCTDAKTLKVISETEQYKYLRVGLPWPFDDRDIVNHFTITQDSATRIVTLTTTSAPDYIPVSDGVVRIRDYQSVYTLTPLAHGRVKIDLEFHADPSGAIPAWLINANIVSGPYTSADEMRKKLPEYQAAQYAFIKEPFQESAKEIAGKKVKE